MTFLLRHWGYETRAVHNGTDAVEAAAEFVPNVAIVDIGLPQLDGFAVAAALREQCSADRLLLVALTGYTQPEFRVRSQEAGFDHYLIKPVAPELLKDLLASSGDRSATPETRKTGHRIGGHSLHAADDSFRPSQASMNYFLSSGLFSGPALASISRRPLACPA